MNLPNTPRDSEEARLRPAAPAERARDGEESRLGRRARTECQH